MSSNWKQQSNKYWCKHCSVYVRDTKLERANHESTARHQGNIKRSLRDLHRSHEQAEREKERAKREVERLNGVVPGSSTSTSTTTTTHGSAAPAPEAPRQATAADRQKQREQLAAMGIEMPSEVRPEMAMAGQWTVTSTKIIEAPKDEDEEKEEQKIEARASGVRKREVTEEEQAVEDAIQGLFKKPKRWGRDSKSMPAEDDAELDALLSGGPFVKKEAVKKAEDVDADAIKKEEDTATGESNVKTEDAIKQEPDDTGLGQLETDTGAGAEAEAPAVVFKKRKPKSLRTK